MIGCKPARNFLLRTKVELVGLAGVQGEEEFEFEVVLPEDAKLKR